MRLLSDSILAMIRDLAGPSDWPASRHHDACWRAFAFLPPRSCPSHWAITLAHYLTSLHGGCPICSCSSPASDPLGIGADLSGARGNIYVTTGFFNHRPIPIRVNLADPGRRRGRLRPRDCRDPAGPRCGWPRTPLEPAVAPQPFGQACRWRVFMVLYTWLRSLASGLAKGRL